MRAYILTEEELNDVVNYLAGGKYTSRTRKVVSQWKDWQGLIKRQIETLERLEAKRK